MINTVGPKLVDKGYKVVAIAKGQKRPYATQWQKNPLSKEACKVAPATDGVGVLCGVGDAPVCAVDVDISNDEAFANKFLWAIYDEFPHFMNVAPRVGKAPKFLIALRAEHAGWRKTSTAVFVKGENKAQLEVLGMGNQFCAYHIHPDTKRPYEWVDETTLGRELVEINANELPLVTWAQIQSLMQRFEQMAVEEGYKRDSSSPQSSCHREVFGDSTVPDLQPLSLPMVGVTVADMRKDLRALVDAGVLDLGSGTHDAWVHLGMAIHHQTGGSAEGLALWDEISALFPQAYAKDGCARKWGSFKHDRPGAVTYRSYSRKAKLISTGWRDSYDEAGLAFRVIRELDGTAVFVTDQGRWYVYDRLEGKWNTVEGENFVFEAVRTVVYKRLGEELSKASQDAAEEIAKFKLRSEKGLLTISGKIEGYLRRTNGMTAQSESFDQTPYLLGVRNGVLDLRSGAITPNSQDLRVLRCCGAVYDESAKCPTWEQALRDWFYGDKQKIAYVQRLLGQMLTGNPKEDVMGILRGIGCNGKSVFLETVAKVMGTYAETISESTLLGVGDERAGQARSDLAKLMGARFVYCSELSQNKNLREADVKRMTGKDRISARAPYGRAEVTMRPTWLLMVGTNYLPNIKGDDEGIWRRICDIEFPRNLKNDPELVLDVDFAEKLDKELSGILNWMLDGWKSYMDGGLRTPDCIKQTTEEYRVLMDDVKAWRSERLLFAPEEHNSILGQSLYTDFATWMKMQGMPVTINKRHFVTRLFKLLGQETGKPRDWFVRRHGDGVRLVKFRLRTDADGSEPLDEDSTFININ